MVDFINSILSYDFLPKLIDLLLVLLHYLGTGIVSFLVFILLFTAIRQDQIQSIFIGLAFGALIVTVILLLFTIIMASSIILLFGIVSLKIGFMDVLNMPELIAGILSFIICLSITALIHRDEE